MKRFEEALVGWQDKGSVAEVFARQVQTESAAANPATPASLSDQPYQITDPAAAVSHPYTPGSFFDADYTDTLLVMIAHVVIHEGPVRDTLLASRIARAHGWQRTGSRIRERVLTLASSRYRTTDEDVGTFYWPDHLDPTIATAFRAPANGNEIRAVDEISLPELTALAQHVLAQGAQGEDVYSIMARQLGLQKLRAASRARLEKAVRFLFTARQITFGINIARHLREKGSLAPFTAP